MSQASFANAINAKVSTVQKWERGVRRPAPYAHRGDFDEFYRAKAFTGFAGTGKICKSVEVVELRNKIH